ncbi:hypothetical protein GCM10022247_16610 [Allokutzneria multivorans]|uniref:DUF3566 domain-containing protein n=1 Tax=Allokutzneria multivorans TaxID=1142134 RepID=A0ABP7RGR1_9PSEU
MTSPQNPDRTEDQAGKSEDRTSLITSPGADGGAEPVEQADAGDGATQAPQETARAEGNGSAEATQKVAKPAKGEGGGPQIDAKTEHIALGSAPPPWQRVTVSGQGTAPPPPTAQQPPGGLGRPPEQPRDFAEEFQDEPTQHTEQPMFAGLSDESIGGRTTVTFPTAGGRPAASAAASAATAAAPSARRTGRGPRRASLQVKRIDPWSVLKLALVLSVALFFVWMVAVGVLYGVLHGMSVWDKLNGTYKDLVQTADGANAEPLISVGRVFGVSAIVGAINIILFTAMATVSAFVYNVSAELAGGVEVTLSERD